MKPKAVAESPVQVSLARSTRHAGVPPLREFERWAVAALGARTRCVVSLLLVGPARSRSLNFRYRGKDKPTNVLSFPPAVAVDVEGGRPLLGDLVICPSVLSREAREQGKKLRDHWAHLFVHGLLHLSGFDHESDEDARRMEGREVRVLRSLGIANPYRSH